MTSDSELGAEDLAPGDREFQQIFERATSAPFPQDPIEQLRLAIEAVFRLAGTASAPSTTATPPRSRTTSAPRSTSARMVFGNLGDDSATGVAMTRSGATGENRASRATT